MYNINYYFQINNPLQCSTFIVADTRHFPTFPVVCTSLLSELNCAG